MVCEAWFERLHLTFAICIYSNICYGYTSYLIFLSVGILQLFLCVFDKGCTLMFATEELGNNSVVLKDMKLGSQTVISQSNIVEEVKSSLSSHSREGVEGVKR